MSSKAIDPREFVLAWKECASVPEVAARLGLTIMAASAYAVRLRAAGVMLPKKNRKPPALDVAALNALINEVK